MLKIVVLDGGVANFFKKIDLKKVRDFDHFIENN